MNKVTPISATDTQHPKPTFKIMTITPEIAGKWLVKQHDRQRRVRGEIKSKFARDMIRSNGWIFNGQPIVIDWDGRVIDGQHRLQACIEADCAFVSLVVEGVDPNAFWTIDTGLKRTLAQVLRMKGYLGTNQLGAVLNKIYAYDQKRTLGRTRASMLETLVYLDDNPRIVTVAREMHGFKYPITGSMAAFIQYNIIKLDPEIAALFFDVLQHGLEALDMPENGSRWNAINNLRTQCYQALGQNVRMFDKDIAAGLITAWNHAYNDVAGPAKKWAGSELPEFAGAKIT